MDAQSLLSTLGSNYGIELTLDERGVCSAGFDADDVDFQLAGNQLCIVAEIGSFQEKNSILKHFFAANLSPAKHAGGYYALDEIYGTVIFIRPMPAEMEYSEFEDILVASLKTIRESKTTLNDLIQNADEDEEKAAMESQPMGFDALSV